MADFVTRAVERLRADPGFSRNRYYLALSSPEGQRALRIHRHLRSLERDLARGLSRDGRARRPSASASCSPGGASRASRGSRAPSSGCCARARSCAPRSATRPADGARRAATSLSARRGPARRRYALDGTSAARPASSTGRRRPRPRIEHDPAAAPRPGADEPRACRAAPPSTARASSGRSRCTGSSGMPTPRARSSATRSRRRRLPAAVMDEARARRAATAARSRRARAHRVLDPQHGEVVAREERLRGASPERGDERLGSSPATPARGAGRSCTSRPPSPRARASGAALRAEASRRRAPGSRRSRTTCADGERRVAAEVDLDASA